MYVILWKTSVSWRGSEVHCYIIVEILNAYTQIILYKRSALYTFLYFYDIILIIFKFCIHNDPILSQKKIKGRRYTYIYILYICMISETNFSCAWVWLRNKVLLLLAYIIKMLTILHPLTGLVCELKLKWATNNQFYSSFSYQLAWIRKQNNSLHYMCA
jgi:hypothetical protein